MNRFGEKQKKRTDSEIWPFKRAVKCSKLRKEIKTPKTAVDEAPIEEKSAIKQLHNEKL